jgi:hypothetical protein
MSLSNSRYIQTDQTDLADAAEKMYKVHARALSAYCAAKTRYQFSPTRKNGAALEEARAALKARGAEYDAALAALNAANRAAGALVTFTR